MDTYQGHVVFYLKYPIPLLYKESRKTTLVNVSLAFTFTNQHEHSSFFIGLG